jgi:exopolysaccharide/PEP-CTERM locus tyrosine autokinase
MSIIEKAINALGKSKDGEKPGKPDDSDTRGAGQRPERTVPRAEEARSGSGPYTNSPPTENPAGGAGQAGSPGTVTIPFRELRKKGILTPTTPRSAIAEQFRTIKRPLLVNIAGDSTTPPIPHGNLIMVTSALEGDGKTFTAICLALSIAMEQDKHVLFVDGDTAKAAAGKTLGVPPGTPGLIDLLESRSKRAEDFILNTNMDKLRILPAGAVHTHANELLASARAREVILDLAEADPSGVILFDSPPLLLTTEAAILASFMGQIVFVVSADQTPQHAVTQAIEHIGEDKMVGMVLNRARRGRNPYIYNYGIPESPYGYASRGDELTRDSEQ